MGPTSSAPLMLSVSGARGIVGESMTAEVARRFAAAFASYVRATTGNGPPTIVLGRDPRPSGAWMEQAAVEGLQRTGAAVIRLGIAATPTVGVAAMERGAAGMVVTASHNPVEWNGLKCITPEGTAPPQQVADEIVRRFHESDVHEAPGGSCVDDDTADQRHVARVLGCVAAESVTKARLSVVLDSNHGAGARSGRRLLEALGCEIVQLGGEPDGRFEHGLEPIEAHLADLARITAERGAAVGFAQDPDADRLAIVDETGRYIGEEYTLVLAAREVFETAGAGPVVTNLSTSRMLDDLAASHAGARVVRTPVGEANVAAAMERAGAVIGGEGNGGVILPAVCHVRDSLGAMALVLSLLARTGHALSDLVNEMPAYVMIKRKHRPAPDGFEPVQAALADGFSHARVNTDDGLRVDLDDAWFHVRPSNTEPIVRVIVEAPTRERAEALSERVVRIGRLSE